MDLISDCKLKCSKCQQLKAPSEFNSDKYNKNSPRGPLSYKCRSCASEIWKHRYDNRTPEKRAEELRQKRDWYVHSKYGITMEEYTNMYLEQNGVCAICLNPETATEGKGIDRKVKNLSVDHDHKTNRVRGLLCFKCNTVLGKIDDSVETLKRAISYLEKSRNVGVI